MKNTYKTINRTHTLAFFAALRGYFPVFLFSQSRQGTAMVYRYTFTILIYYILFPKYIFEVNYEK